MLQDSTRVVHRRPFAESFPNVFSSAINNNFIEVFGIEVIKHRPKESGFTCSNHTLNTANKWRLKQIAVVREGQKFLVFWPGFARYWDYW